ncbi:MAG: helix-turn-helix domain-containing protein [Bacteroidales bacterium]|nr:helix-turn-helix domain-containing protein [Bacteroidales bacterium]
MTYLFCWNIFSGNLNRNITDQNSGSVEKHTIHWPDIIGLADIEKVALLQAMEKTGGNVSKAARILDLSRTTLYSKMEKYDL